jgi:signal transduction histidine kinase/sensor domain CHASE-containing protein
MSIRSVARWREHRWTGALLLGALGLLLNAFPLSLSPGIDALFGGVAYLLAAVAFGPGPGMLAASIASVRTVWLWNHPWAWLIFALEGLVVGYLCLRWRQRPVAAAALFWLVIGAPLILLTYWGIMGVAGTTLWIIVLKQPLNGLVNAVIAEALLLIPAMRRVLRLRAAPRLREALAMVVLVAAIGPALLFGIWSVRREWARSVETASDRVELAAASYAGKLEQYVELHSRSVRSLARTIDSSPDLSALRVQRLLDAERDQFPGFLNMYVADARASVLAFNAAVEYREPGTLNYSDRPYFREVRETRRTVVSDVFAGRGGADQPLVIIAHPLIQADTFAGFVLGALDLARFPEPTIARSSAERLRVVDAGGNVVFDQEEPYFPGDTVRRVPDENVLELIRAADGPGVTSYTLQAPAAAAAVVAAEILTGYAPVGALGWHVWVDHPYRQIESATAIPYARLMVFLVALFIGAGLLSDLLAGWLAAPLLRMRWAAAALAAGDRSARVRGLHAGVPAEINELGRGFDEMADTLAERAQELEELSEIARSLASTLDSDELLRQITDAANRLLRADGCGIVLLAPEPDVLRAADYTLGLLAPAAGRELPMDDSLVGWVLRNERPIRVTQLGGSTHVYRTGVSLAGIGSVVSAPLMGRTGPLGALTAVRAASRPHPFVEDEMRLLERLARTAAVAVENARLIEAAQAASRAKSDFIAAMSHELRTPLNAVLGHLQLLELEIHGGLTAEQKGALGRIGAATRHLRGLIEEVLSFARLEAGRAELHLEEVDLCELVREVAAVIEPLAWEKELGFHIDPCDVPTLVRTDPDKVRQILINLAGNAVKFTERGEVRLRVMRRDAEDGEGQAVVRVADTGPGISEGDRERLFRPFEQLESGLSRRHGGTGLGLYLSGQYAHLIGGRIEVRSRPGEGSVFSLVLPGETSESEPDEVAGGAAGVRGGVRG